MPAYPSFFPRPFEHPGFPVFCRGAAAGLMLAGLLYAMQPQHDAPPLAHNPPPEQCSPQVFLHAVPVGFISEVRASGPSLRAVAAAWPVGTVVAELPETAPADGLAAYDPPAEADLKAIPSVPDPESSAR